MQTSKTVEEWKIEERFLEATQRKATLVTFSPEFFRSNPDGTITIELPKGFLAKVEQSGRTLGLQEALGAGPEKAEDTFEGETRYSKGVVFGHNSALSAKNSAISALIEKGEQGKV